jgi:hypothetical protein
VEKESKPQSDPVDETNYVEEVDEFLRFKKDAEEKVEKAIQEWNRKHPNARIQ